MSNEIKKRKRRNIIETFPLDCWSHIITFFSEYEDLLNIVLSINRLWGHIKIICPHCTRHILFKLKRNLPLKNSRVSHVHKLVHHEDSVMCQPNTDENSVNRFFVEIFEIFRNLEVFNVWIKSKPGDTHENASITIFEPQRKDERLARNLRILELTLHGSNLTLNSFFPHLELLDLTDYNNRRHQNISTHSLEIDWKKFPRLQSLILYGWKLVKSLNPSRETLRNLKLVSTILIDEEISDFLHLESIFLGLRTIEQVKKIERLNELIKLSFEIKKVRKGETKLLFENWDYYESRLTSSFQIKNFPKLKFITLSQDRCSSERVWNHVSGHNNMNRLVLHNLPSLCEFSATWIAFDFEISDTSNLKSVVVHDCPDSETKFLSRIEVSALTYVYYGESFFSPHIVSLIPFMKNLREIEVDNLVTGDLYQDEDVTKIVGFEHLLSVFIMNSDIYLSEVSKCPNLESLYCKTIEEDFTLSELPKLNSVGSRGYESDVETFFKGISTQPQVEFLSLHHFFFSLSEEDSLFCNKNIGNILGLYFLYCASILYNGENSSKLRFIKMDEDFDCNCGRLKLSNHPNLHSVEYGIEKDDCSFEIENCPRLTLIDLDFGFSKKLKIELKGLQSNVYLKMTGFYRNISSFATDSACIKKLCITRIEVKDGLSRENGFMFRIDGKTFPFLREIEIRKRSFAWSELEEGYTYCQIEEISNVKTLEFVAVEEGEVEYSKKSDNPFVKKVVRGDMDLEEIVFFSVSQEYFGYEDVKNDISVVKSKTNFKKFINESKSILLE